MTTANRTPFEDTSVPVSRSQEQIRRFLRDAGALGVQFSEEWVEPPIFRVRFSWPLTPEIAQTVRLEVSPLAPDKRRSVEQRERQAWRGLAHYLEGTIKAATFGLVRFEDIFLSFFEDDRGLRVGDVLIPQITSGHLALERGVTP